MLTECLTHFSENKIGGLVVIQGRESVERFVRGGILLKGLVSGPLLQSIFDNHSPGHDGGVLILNGILDKFAVHLPLSRNAQGMGRLGTRHSAALGLSEKCDALILVVSEESGTISLGKNGKLTTVKSKTALSEAIRDHLKRLAPIPIYKGVFRIPWLRLSTSLALSFSLWITLVRPTNLVQRTMEVPIFYRNLPKLWEAKAPDPSKVKITLMGPEGVILPLGITDVAGTIDLGRVREGQQGIALSDLNFNLPYRIRVMNIEPREIAMQAYPVVEHELPVRVIWSDSLGRTPNSQSVKITPAKISVKLPRSTPPPAFLETEPVSSAQLRSGKMQVKLRLSPEIQFSDVSATRVELAP